MCPNSREAGIRGTRAQDPTTTDDGPRVAAAEGEDEEDDEWPLVCRSFLHWMPTLRCDEHFRLHRLHVFPLPLLPLLTGDSVKKEDEDEEDVEDETVGGKVGCWL